MDSEWRALPAIMLIVPVAAADIVYFKDGRKLEGEVVERTADSIRLKTKFGTYTFALSEIERIEKTVSSVSEYASRTRRVSPGDARANLQLADWCEKNGLRAQAIKHYVMAGRGGSEDVALRAAAALAKMSKHAEAASAYESVLKENPRSEEARAGLEKAMRARGLVFFNGEWVTEKDRMRAQDKVLWRGKWVTEDEMRRGQEAGASRKAVSRARALMRTGDYRGAKSLLKRHADAPGAMELLAECEEVLWRPLPFPIPITSRTVLLPGRLYLIEEATIVPEGTTLTVGPGVEILFDPDQALRVKGRLVVRGTAEAPVRFSPDGEPTERIGTPLIGVSAPGRADLSFCLFEGVRIAAGSSQTDLRIVDCRFRGASVIARGSIVMRRCEIANEGPCTMLAPGGAQDRARVSQNIFHSVKNDAVRVDVFSLCPPVNISIARNHFRPGAGSSFNLRRFEHGTGDINVADNWWGTTDPARISELIHDAEDTPTLGGRAIFEPFLRKPPADAGPTWEWRGEE